MIIVNLHACIHVFDPQKARYIKSSAGNLRPEDVNMTRAIIEAGKLLDIRVLDHVIIGLHGFTSIRQKHPSLWA